MSKIDYSKYNITATSQFYNGLAKLHNDGQIEAIKKLFRLISEIVQGLDMYELEYSRPLKNSRKLMYIHLDGRQTGDIVFIYTTSGRDIDLDLRLHNITDHKNLSRVSSPKFTNKQKLEQFSVVENKYSQSQIEYAENCYLDIISDYNYYQLSDFEKQGYVDNYIKEYIESENCSDPLTLDEFSEIIYYLQNLHGKKIIASLDFSEPQHTHPITLSEEQYIISIFYSYDLEIKDAYIESEVDEYGDRYESMYVEVASDDFRSIKLAESELHSLDRAFGIIFGWRQNGLGRYGRTYELSHYFE